MRRPSTHCQDLEQTTPTEQKRARDRAPVAPSSAPECPFGAKIRHFLRKVVPKMGFRCLQRTDSPSGLHSSHREFSSRGCAAFRRPPTPTKACRRIRRRQRAEPGALRAFCDAASRGEGTVFGQFFWTGFGSFRDRSFPQLVAGAGVTALKTSIRMRKMENGAKFDGLWNQVLRNRPSNQT